jgi:predicted ribosomally synthesized peptide with SipW-like signal peptide
MKKIGLIALIVVLALGIIGVGYAAWSQTLTATGTVNSGTFKADFTTAVTDDLGTAYGTGVVDPKIAGTYNGTTWSVATSSTQDVGWTTAPQISGLLLHNVLRN